MKFLLKLIPFPMLINALCALIKDKVTKHTKTELDDHGVDLGCDIAKEAASCIVNPTPTCWKDWLKRSLIKIMDFVSEDILKEVRDYIDKKIGKPIDRINK